MMWPGEGHVLKEPLSSESSHLQQGVTVGTQVPVPPLLDAAGQVFCHFSDALAVASAAAKQQGQPGLDESTCGTVPILAPGLCLRQDQFHQAEQLWALDMEHQLLPPLLQSKWSQVSPRTCRHHPQG